MRRDNMEKQKFDLCKEFMNDVVIFSHIKNNFDYSEELIGKISLMISHNIKSYDDFIKSGINFEPFSYQELTYFNRIKDEQYFELLSEVYNKVETELKQTGKQI